MTMGEKQEGGHTPGPWLMAAKPSSVVGWPIVAPQAGGRVVCSLNYADRKAFGGPQPGDRTFNAESEANGRLIAAAPDLLSACKAAKKYLEPSLTEPGRTVFWMLVDAIAKAKGQP